MAASSLDWTGVEVDTPDLAGTPTRAPGPRPELAGGSANPDAFGGRLRAGVALREGDRWRGSDALAAEPAPSLATLVRADARPRPGLAADFGVAGRRTRLTADLVADPGLATAVTGLRGRHVGHRASSRMDTEPAEPSALGDRTASDSAGSGSWKRLGQGGMGRVYRAEDIADGSVVASQGPQRADDRQVGPRPSSRFLKEARLLAEVNNPRVTNFIEVNEDDGIHYLALEFVRGTDLAAWRLGARGAIAEREARWRSSRRGPSPGGGPRAGDRPPRRQAREHPGRSTTRPTPRARPGSSSPTSAWPVTSSRTSRWSMTRDGAIIGTPLYMSPEQCAGESKIGPPSDVYAMGATSVHPDRRPAAVYRGIADDRDGQAPDRPGPRPQGGPVRGQRRGASIVAKAMAKEPARRYADSGEMLLDLERLLRGEPTGLDVHPRLPACDPRERGRLRLAMGDRGHPPGPLADGLEHRAVQPRHRPELGPVRGRGRATRGARSGRGSSARRGSTSPGREHPFEWIEGRRMGVVREFERGPFEWFVSVVELSPRSGAGPTSSHQVRVKPRGMIGRTLAAVEIGTRGRKSIDRVYRRIDATLTGKLGRDPIDRPLRGPRTALGRAPEARLETWLDSMGDRGFDPTVVERLGDFLELAPAQEVARIRPLEPWPGGSGLAPDPVVAACLRGASRRRPWCSSGTSSARSAGFLRR